MKKMTAEKQLKKYIVITVLFALFGGIYEIFSHGVFSPYMAFSFLIPLVFGVLPAAVLTVMKKESGLFSSGFYFSALFTFTVWSVIKGVLDIYGTTNGKTVFYPVFCAVMVILCIITSFIKSAEKNR